MEKKRRHALGTEDVNYESSRGKWRNHQPEYQKWAVLLL